ncbi:HAMP domain-containing histidine kinase [bacterium]|nr:MAG: HAMP domain-containing histidine kinase [bacterium]
MSRSFFSRVFLQSVFVLLALIIAGGVALDRFLTESEINRLGDQVERFALMLREDTVRHADFSGLQPLVRRLGDATRVRFTVVDKTGKVLADSHLDPSVMENHSTHPEVAEALAGREGRNLRHSASLGIEMLYVAIPGDPVFRAAVPVSEVKAVLGQVRMRMALAAVPAVLIALLLAWFLARSLNSRIERMIRFASAIEKGDYSQILRSEGDDELADMERSLTALRDEIEKQVEKLRRDKETLSALIEGFPHAVFVFDKDKNLSLANSHARKLLRIASLGVFTFNVGEAIRNPKVLEAVESVSAGEAASEPFRISWSEPHRKFEVTVHPLPGEDGNPEVLLVLRDITRETHLEKVRSDFIVNLAHELRTPLTAIRGSAETVLDSALSDPVAVKKFLETIKRNSLRLENLLTDVSDLARAETAAEKVKIASFDAREPARHVSELFAGEAQKNGIAMKVSLPEEPLFMDSDPEKIEQILINLVQNAVRYTLEGGEVSISLGREEGGVVYTVADTGIGIPPEDLPRVTERFYRVDPGRSRAMGGTGLGLSIVKHLAESLGARLEIASEYGKGTTVRVTVPA